MGRPGAVGAGRDRFGLSGASQAFDPRMVAIRPDLADIAIAGMHFPPHYVAPKMTSSVLPAAAMRAAPSLDAETTTEQQDRKRLVQRKVVSVRGYHGCRPHS